MSHEGRRAEDVWFYRVKTLWPIIAAVVGIVFGYAKFGSSVENQEKRLATTEDRVEKNTQEITRLTAVVEQLPEMRKDIKEILRRSR